MMKINKKIKNELSAHYSCKQVVDIHVCTENDIIDYHKLGEGWWEF